jgi:hypothetical protein
LIAYATNPEKTINCLSAHPIKLSQEIDGVINLTSFDIEVPIPYPNASVGAGYPAAPPNVTRSLRKGYYAAVTFTDWNIGLALDELERLGAKKMPLVCAILYS